MSQQYWDIIKNAADGSAEILLYGDIGGFDYDTYQEINTAKKFTEEFKALEKEFSLINVRINSYGGSMGEGIAISNAIAQSSSEVHTWIDGVAMSMAGLIAISGHKVHMAENAILMIHNSSSGVYGNAADHREMAKTLDVFDKSMALLISSKTGQPVEDATTTFLNYKDNFFTSDEAAAASLVDIVEPIAVEGVPSASAFKGKTYASIAAQHIQSMKAPEAKQNWFAMIRAALTPKEKPKPESKMNFESLKAALESGKILALSADEKASILEEITAALKEGDVITASDLSDVKASLSTSEQALKVSNQTITDAAAVLGVEVAEIVATATSLKSDHALVCAKLEKLAPGASINSGDDPPPEPDPSAQLAHNQRADQAHGTSSIH